MESPAVEALLQELIPGLLRCVKSEKSVVRKDAFKCLVAMEMKVGEAKIKPHITSLTTQQVLTSNYNSFFYVS